MSKESVEEKADLRNEFDTIGMQEANEFPIKRNKDPPRANGYGISPGTGTGNPNNYVFEPRERNSFKEENNNENPMAIWYPNAVDPSNLSPTYSMVSFCPFLGKCCFFPMNFIPPHQCGTCCEKDQVTPPKPKIPIPAPKPIALKEKPAHLSLQNPKPPPFDPKERENIPKPPVKKEPLVVFTQESNLNVNSDILEPQLPQKSQPPKPPQGRSMKKVEELKPEPKPQPCQPCPEAPKCPVCSQPVDPSPAPPILIPFEEPTAPIRVKEEIVKEVDVKEIDEHGRGTKKLVKNQPSELFADRKVVNKDVDMEVIRKESLLAFKSEYKGLEPGIQGIKALVNERSKTAGTGLLDFVDYFTKKDGTKYIGMLEQYFIEFYEKTKSEILYASNKNPGFTSKAEEVRKKISDSYRIVQVEDEKELQDYDFPATIEKDLRVFGMNLMSKINQLAKIHNYGVQMILFWVKQLDEKKSIDPISIYHTGTELMADVMVIVYSIYTKLADFFVQIVTHPTQKQVDTYTLEFFIKAFRNLVDGICDEVGAIGESCGQIMIRIPNLQREKVVEIMKNLYKQVNYAHVSCSRAMESLAPAIHLWIIRFYLNRENNKQRIVDSNDKTKNTKRFVKGGKERYQPQ